MGKDQKTFWETVPGILTGCGAILGALVGIGSCLAALVGAGLFPSPFLPTQTPGPIPPVIFSPPHDNNTPVVPQPSSTTDITPPPADNPFDIFTLTPTDTPATVPTPFYQGPPLIAFVSNSSGRLVIYTMYTDGTNQRFITPFEYDSDTPSWAPDGQWIYFSSNREGNYDIYKMRWDGSEITRITTDSRDEQWPRMSPDRTKIVYSVKLGEKHEQVFVMNQDGSNAQNISNSPMREYRATWLPDSRQLVFSLCGGPNSPEDLRCEIYGMDSDGTRRRNITTSDYSEILPAISPDGSTIAFTANIRSYISDAVSNIDIFLINFDGTDGKNARRITTSLTVDSDAAWSPDGSKIIFRAAEGEGPYDIWVISSNGSGLSQLTSLAGNETYPVWQP